MPLSDKARAEENVGVLLVVAVGGGLGSLLRYAVTRAFPDPPDAFPWGRFTVNVGGCLLLRAFLVLVVQVWLPGRYLHPMVAVGLIGGMTTFSTFVEQLRELGVAGAWDPPSPTPPLHCCVGWRSR